METIGNDEGMFSIQSESGKLLYKLGKDKKSTIVTPEICNLLHNSL